MHTRLAHLLVAAALATIGCAPADVAGRYNVAVTNGVNECGFDNWTVGSSQNDIELVVTQADDQVALDVGGAVGVVLDVAVGASVFNGTVSGNSIDAVLIGTNAARTGECTYTTTIEVDASLDGDVLSGELHWIPQTNNHPDCGVRNTDCETRQTLLGTRPPSAD